MVRTVVVIAGAVALALGAAGVAFVGGRQDQSELISAPSTSDATLPPRAPSTTVVEEQAVGLPSHLAHLEGRWETNWTVRTIDLEELRVGVPAPDPRDAIPPIDQPVFESVSTASEWLADREPGLLLSLDGAARFYPLRILTLHEVVNDEIAGTPIVVTFCPLCNTGVAFERGFEGQVLRFGVSGLLRNSDLVMWDDATVSLWQQITGEAIVGDLAGNRLVPVPTSIVRWADFKDSFPEGEVLSRDTGIYTPGSYGINPYEYYSSQNRPLSFFRGEIDDRYPALERVVGVTIGDAAKAYPFSEIAEVRTVNDVVGSTPIVVLWGAEDTADALDSQVIALGRSIGTGLAFSRVVDGKELTFTAVDDTTFIDDQTRTTWNILGRAVAGPLEGTQLETVIHRNEFWFAWQAFFPEAPVFAGD